MDKYDEQIAGLRSGELNMTKEWLYGRGVFAFAHNHPYLVANGSGCLSMIRQSAEAGRTDYQVIRDGKPDLMLTDAIGDDTRIPHQKMDITLDHLEVFAEWQRRLDKELRSPPESIPSAG